MNKNNIKIWCTYHDPEIPKEYNLYETENFKLFYNNDFNLKEDNINYLHDFLDVMTTYYYVWKNQIKSDYVGFCQYKRHYEKINFDYIDDKHVQAIHSVILTFDMVKNDLFNTMNNNGRKLWKLLNNYFNEKYNFDLNNFNDDNFLMTMHSSYIMNWKVFNEVCDFIFGFLDYISDYLKLDWKSSNDMYDILKYFSINKSDVYFYQRDLAILFEFTLGIFMGIFYNAKTFLESNPNTLITYQIDDKDLLLKMYKLNIKTGVQHIYNISNIIFDNNDYNYGDCGYIMEKLIIIENKNINTFIKDNKNKNIILLKDNEYIDCDDFEEFNKGNYTIKTI